MIKEKLFGILKLTRIELCIFATIGLFVSGELAQDLVGIQIEFLIAFFIVFLSAGGAFAINDYFDYEIDKVNNRIERPLVIGLVSRKTALIIAIAFFILVVSLSFSLNIIARVFCLINFPLYYLYSIGLKKIVFIKNILIAYSYFIVIVFGSLISDATLEPIIIYFGIMGFFVGLGSEIMFDIADREGDRELGVKTIPTKFGTKKAALISIIMYVTIIIMDPLPFYVLIDSRFYFDYLFLILINIPIVGYIFISISLFKNQSKENTLNLRKLIFVVMQIGTIVYLVGALI